MYKNRNKKHGKRKSQRKSYEQLNVKRMRAAVVRCWGSECAQTQHQAATITASAARGWEALAGL